MPVNRKIILSPTSGNITIKDGTETIEKELTIANDGKFLVGGEGAGKGDRCVALSAEQGSTLSSAGRSFLPATGAAFLSFSGTGPDTECGFQFQVPEGYISGGEFIVSFTTAAAAGDTVAFFMDVTTAASTENLNTTDDTAIKQFIAGSAVSWDGVKLSPFTTSNAVYAPGTTVIVRIYRDTSDVDDVYTGTAYISELIFKYVGE